MHRRAAFLAFSISLCLTAAACSDGVSDASKTSTTIKGGVTTSTAAGAGATTKPPATTKPSKADKALATKLLAPSAFGTGWKEAVGSVGDPGSGPCSGVKLSTDWEARASIAAESPDGTGVGGEQLIEFSDEAAASSWFDDFKKAADACAKGEDALKVSFRSVDGFGDEAIRAVPSAGGQAGSLDMVVARSGAQVVAVFAFTENGRVRDETVAAALDKASG